jgi:hypothetical protein
MLAGLVMTRAGIINAKLIDIDIELSLNINNSKYLSIIDGCGDDDCDVLAALWYRYLRMKKE